MKSWKVVGGGGRDRIGEDKDDNGGYLGRMYDLLRVRAHDDGGVWLNCNRTAGLLRFSTLCIPGTSGKMSHGLSVASGLWYNICI